MPSLGLFWMVKFIKCGPLANHHPHSVAVRASLCQALGSALESLAWVPGGSPICSCDFANELFDHEENPGGPGANSMDRAGVLGLQSPFFSLCLSHYSAQKEHFLLKSWHHHQNRALITLQASTSLFPRKLPYHLFPLPPIQ